MELKTIWIFNSATKGFRGAYSFHPEATLAEIIVEIEKAREGCLDRELFFDIDGNRYFIYAPIANDSYLEDNI